MTIEDYTHEAVALLSRLIATPSVSGDEAKAADIMAECIAAYGLKPQREGNNVWVVAPGYDENRSTLLLNAHLDTVRAVDSWTKNPFEPTLDGDLLYGLGSNDCGGGLVSLLQVFRLLIQHPQSYNLVYLASAEEEVSGKDGIERVLPLLPRIDLGIVGEPTEMQPAVAEKGLMVLDITSRGVSGHAARNEGVNAIYAALPDLEWLRTYQFEKVSDFLGQTKMTVTMLNAGTQHNVRGEVQARSFRLGASHIGIDHPVIVRCVEMGMKPFGSPTLSDQALMPFTSLKLGPGASSRSHAADEFIKISEIRHALQVYIALLDGKSIT